MPITPWLPKSLPWLPSDYTDEVVMAVRAVFEGKANAAQQQTFFRWLMYATTASEEFADLSFRPADKGGTDAMIFAEGKRFVGIQIRKMLRPELTPKPIAPSVSLPVQQRLRKRRTGAA
jgi:hypothetical protein